MRVRFPPGALRATFPTSRTVHEHCICIVVAAEFRLGPPDAWRKPDASTVPARWTEAQRRFGGYSNPISTACKTLWNKKAAFCTVLKELKAADAQLAEEAMLLHAAGDKDANGEPKDPDNPIWPKFYKLYHHVKYLRALASAVANSDCPFSTKSTTSGATMRSSTTNASGPECSRN